MPQKTNNFRLVLSLLSFTFGTLQCAFCQIPEPQNSSDLKINWVTSEIKGPGVSFHTFDSDAAKTQVSYHIYKPKAYEQDSTRRFPVVYWLHGSGGGLPGIPRVASWFDAAIEAGKAPPCLVVFVNGLAEGMYVDWKDGSAPIETVIVKELLPHIDSAYRTIASREGRILDGYSMGGYGAARLGFKHTELFKGISIMGGGPLQPELVQTPRAGRQRAAEVLQKVYGNDQEYFKNVSPRRLAQANAEAISTRCIIRHVCGDLDETYANNLAFHLHLEKLGIPHQWRVLQEVDHNPMKTLAALGDSNWEFYNSVFNAPKTTTLKHEKPDFELVFDVEKQLRRAIVVNAPIDNTLRPVVLALHGGQGSAKVMQANSGFDQVARKNDFMVVYPEGTEFGNNRHAWNTGFLLRRQVQNSNDVAYLDTLIDKLIADHGADPSRVYITGGSNGGMMTFVYAVARTDRLAAAAPVVASMFTFDSKPTSPLPILIINGAKDDEVPIEGGMSRNPLVRRGQEAPFKSIDQVVEFWMQVNKSQSQPTIVKVGTLTNTTYASSADGAPTELIVDSVGGHGWPGSRARRENTTPITAFSGAEKVWDFFKDKKRIKKDE
jgi:poly(hydroxyalkanoate) depolymerase family esterase